MATDEITFPDQLRQLIDYDPETGALTWKPRAISWFTDTPVRGGFIRSAEMNCRQWNTKHAGKPALSTRIRSGHLQGGVLGTKISAHRAAWAIYFGVMPERQIDHINGDPSDNRIANLRDVGRVDNARNQRLHMRNTSGHAGVICDKRYGTWAASIGSGEGGHSKIHLGTFATKAEAIAARRAAEIVLGYHPNHGRPVSSTCSASREWQDQRS